MKKTLVLAVLAMLFVVSSAKADEWYLTFRGQCAHVYYIGVSLDSSQYRSERAAIAAQYAADVQSARTQAQYYRDDREYLRRRLSEADYRASYALRQLYGQETILPTGRRTISSIRDCDYTFTNLETYAPQYYAPPTSTYVPPPAYCPPPAPVYDVPEARRPRLSWGDGLLLLGVGAVAYAAGRHDSHRDDHRDYRRPDYRSPERYDTRRPDHGVPQQCPPSRGRDLRPAPGQGRWRN